METIKISNLGKSYNGRQVFSGLNTNIAKGRVVALLGRNGAGKSTLLNILNGQLAPSTGSSTTLGIDPEADAARLRQKCVLVSEDCHLYSWMTATLLAHTFSSLYPDWHQQTYENLLRQFKIDAHQKVAILSKGMRRKLQLAFALATGPEVLLLDEPVGGVDVVARDEILNSIIESLVVKGVTVVISSHELHDIAGVCDHVLILSEGRFVVDCSREELSGSIRRVVATLEAPAAALPSHPAILHARANGSELEMVIKDFSEEELQKILASYRVKTHTVAGLSLAELFKAITGQEK
ncbi:MAG TPA: ABC transporter ATP-binding protein [Candidatus Rifleibacterium sp.]|nr:ABC transporter ATP-binding protein [Candidatus Rifleibacterium sp.]HPT48038.1 ABC transporter ATP-binding protein [Candidatus Rifleibacterium sp.]